VSVTISARVYIFVRMCVFGPRESAEEREEWRQ